jgi:hypothetical protein
MASESISKRARHGFNATLEGESWLMHNSYADRGRCQSGLGAETGALVLIGDSKFGGGLGGYAQYIASVHPIGHMA